MDYSGMNIFQAVAQVQDKLKKNGRREDARALLKVVMGSKSHDEALRHLRAFESGAKLLPAGRYIISDPCYVLKDEVYQQLLEMDDARWEGVYEVNGVKMGIVGTKHGDGRYDGYAVDSGHIACIPLEGGVLQPFTYVAGSEENVVRISDGHYMVKEAFTPFEVSYDDENGQGLIIFGNLETIQTGENPKCEWCGEEEGYCECDENENEDENEDEDYDF